MKKTLALVLAAIMLIAAFAGCGGGSGSGKGSSTGKGVFRTFINTTATTLYAVNSSDPVVSKAASYCTTSLYTTAIDESGKSYYYYGQLAESEPVQMDTEGKVWQIKIRKGYKWANGDEMNADTVIFSYKTAIDPLLMNVSATNIYNNQYLQIEGWAEYAQQNMLGIVKEFSETGMKKIDDYTIEVTTVKPTTTAGVMRFFDGNDMVHEPTWNKAISPDGASTLYGTSLEYFMSSGEYLCTEWITDSLFKYEKNTEYVHTDKIHFAGVELRVIPDANTALQMFLNGELDTALITYNQWADYEDDPRVYEYWEDSTMFLFVNNGNPNFNGMLKNYNFRKAMYYGIDRMEFANTIGGYPSSRLFRRAVVGDSLTGRSILDLECTWADDPYTMFNPTLATEYVDKAFEETKNKNVTFEIYYKEDGTHTRAATEIMQRQLTKNLEGVNIKLRSVPQAQAYTLRRWNPSNPTSYDMNVGSLLPGNQPLDTMKFYGSNYQPIRFYWNDETQLAAYDKLYNEAVIFNDEGKEAEMVANCLEMERILVKEAMQQIPIYEIPTKQLYAENIELPGDGYVIDYGFGDRYGKFVD